MKNGLLYLILGGLGGYIVYTYLKEKEPKMKKNKIAEMIGNMPSMVIESTTETIDTRPPIFNPKIERHYNINTEPVKPHLTIYKSEQQQKEEILLSDMILDKQHIDVKYISVK